MAFFIQSDVAQGGLRVEWYFRDISDDPSEKELTQQDQFNNDEVGLAEALVRETIQNSTDASANGGQVRVRFALHNTPASTRTTIIRLMVNGLAPNLKASELAVPQQGPSMRLLVIEDFETTGLQGAVDVKDDGQFCGFWRRFGRSNKKQAEGGRWGLGKLVFPSASQVRTVVGLTRRADDPSSWLMGQAILAAPPDSVRGDARPHTAAAGAFEVGEGRQGPTAASRRLRLI